MNTRIPVVILSDQPKDYALLRKSLWFAAGFTLATVAALIVAPMALSGIKAMQCSSIMRSR